MKLLANRTTKRLLTTLLLVIVGYFFYVSLRNNWQAVQEINYNFNGLSVAAILLFVLAVVVSGYLWGKTLDYLTESTGKRIDKAEAVRVHIASWLLKYVPGQAGSAINKIAWAKKHGYSKKLVLITFVYENVFLLVASFALSVPLLLALSGSNAFTSNAVYTLVPLLFLLIAAAVLNGRSMHALANFIFTKLLKQPVGRDFFLTNSQSFKLQLYYLLPRLLNAVSFVLVVVSFLEVSASAYVPLGAAYILAGAVGILAIFVPSGIGVREAVIVIFAGQFMPVEQAIIAAIVARLYSTVADGVLAVGYALLNLKKSKEITS